MKQRKFFLLTAICVALTLVLGACGDDIKAEAEKAGLILSDDGKTVTGVKDKAMTDCIIPDGVTDIGDKAFADCTKLTSITIPNSVTSIGDGAFSWCRSLTSITIPDSVTSIGEWAFSRCSNLTSITIPAKFTDANVKRWDLPPGCKIIRK
ncbi:MAG: leucine-rich repeat domain-containing protein [Lentisphaeria bacterium]|nr:leucine-rich repeat domain-containing protein [Lentisphaeria bacterium]